MIITFKDVLFGAMVLVSWVVYVVVMFILTRRR